MTKLWVFVVYPTVYHKQFSTSFMNYTAHRITLHAINRSIYLTSMSVICIYELIYDISLLCGVFVACGFQ